MMQNKPRKPRLKIRTFGKLITDLALRNTNPDANVRWVTNPNTKKKERTTINEGMPTITFRGGDGVEFDEVLISYYCDYTDPVHPYYSQPRHMDKDSFGGSFEAIVFRTHTNIHFSYDLIIGGYYIARVGNKSLPQEIQDAIIQVPTWKEKQEAEEEVCS